MKEKISVIMSIYKESESELKSSIESILNQTYSNLEFIVVVDNPYEKWRINLLNSYTDDRMKIIVNRENLGLPKSLNIALSNATGEYIARMDADDIAFPIRFEKQYEFLKETGYDMCGANVTCFIDNANFKEIIFPRNAENVKKLLFIKNCVSHPTYFAKRNVYEKLKGYNNVFSCEDYDFLLRAVGNNITIGNVQDVLLRYRINPQSISRKNAGKQELIAKYLRECYKKNPLEEKIEEMVKKYLDSKEFKKNLKSYNFYWGMKNTRSKYKERKGIKYYCYTILLAFNFKHSIKEIHRKLYENRIIKSEARK